MKARKGKFKVAFLKGEYEGYIFDKKKGYSGPYLTYPARERFIHDLGAFTYEKINTEDGELLLFPIGKNQLEWTEIKEET